MGADELAYGVLGALEVSRGGTSLPLPSGRQRSVLAALVVRVGIPVTGDALIEAAWGDAWPADPRADLHTLVSRLRARLGWSAIRREPDGYRLVATPEQVDSGRFDALRLRAGGRAAGEAVELLNTALGLWRGSAYAEFADRDFAMAEAVRLDELRLGSIENRAQLLIELASADLAAADLEALVTAYPLRERAYGLLMTALYRSGRVGAALDTYQTYRRTLADELGLDPSPVLQDLQHRLLNRQLEEGPALPVGPSTVGSSADSADSGRAIAVSAAWRVGEGVILGREDELASLLDLTRRRRLVTVTGMAGIGKTRLVAEILPSLAGRRGLDPVVVELGDVGGAGLLAAIAAGAGVQPATGDVGGALLEYLSVTPLLMVLDGCEHLLADLVPWIRAALRRCPDLCLVCTSRRRLGVEAEHVLPLEPLPTGSIGEAGTVAELSAAVRLFVDRARRVRPTFALTERETPAVADICRRLDGLPLAIELAATRAATLGVEPLRDRLDQRLDLLEDDLPGERSIRTALDWSYQLLGAAERLLFACLGVFEGAFDLDAVESVAEGLVDRVPVRLAELVDASLVVNREVDLPRYRLLETVRVFARERLAA